MEVKINKEIRDYKENIYFGLNLRQFVFTVLACLTAVLFYFVFRKKLNTEILSWVCMLGASPFIAIGFIKYNGMTFERLALSFIKTEILTPTHLLFKPKNLYYEIKKEVEKNET